MARPPRPRAPAHPHNRGRTARARSFAGVELLGVRPGEPRPARDGAGAWCGGPRDDSDRLGRRALVLTRMVRACRIRKRARARVRACVRVGRQAQPCRLPETEKQALLEQASAVRVYER